MLVLPSQHARQFERTDHSLTKSPKASKCVQHLWNNDNASETKEYISPLRAVKSEPHNNRPQNRQPIGYYTSIHDYSYNVRTSSLWPVPIIEKRSCNLTNQTDTKNTRLIRTLVQQTRSMAAL